jgi:hypothetical protein
MGWAYGFDEDTRIEYIILLEKPPGKLLTILSVRYASRILNLNFSLPLCELTNYLM